MLKDIERGEIYWVDWNPGRGSEQSGLRPALVIQNDVGNKFSPTTIVAALTTAAEKPYPFLVNVTAKESGLPKDSTVNLAVILTIDKSRLTDKCGELSEARMAEVDKAIKASLNVNKIGLLLLSEEWLPLYVKDTKGIYQYRDILKQLLLDKITLNYLIDTVLSNVDDNAQYRILNSLNVLRAIIRNNPFGNAIDTKTNNKLFDIFKVYVFHKNEEIRARVNTLLIGRILDDQRIGWLVSNWSKSEHIVNRLLRYPEKHPLIGKWARRIYARGTLVDRRSEIIGILLDENIRVFDNQENDKIVWGIYYSHLSTNEKQELLIDRFSFESIDSLWAVALRLRLDGVLEYMRKKVLEVTNV